jgi:hypothetical protein
MRPECPERKRECGKNGFAMATSKNDAIFCRRQSFLVDWVENSHWSVIGHSNILDFGFPLSRLRLSRYGTRESFNYLWY